MRWTCQLLKAISLFHRVKPSPCFIESSPLTLARLPPRKLLTVCMRLAMPSMFLTSESISDFISFTLFFILRIVSVALMNLL